VVTTRVGGGAAVVWVSARGATASTVDGGIGRLSGCHRRDTIFSFFYSSLPLARQTSLRFRWSLYSLSGDNGATMVVTGDATVQRVPERQRTRVDGVLHP